MRYRKLGTSDIVVSEISFGSWLTISGGVERSRAIACLDRALNLGINFIDTANIYGRGIAEEVIGEALADRPRASYILGTKLFFPMTDTDRGLSAAQIHKQIDDSLRRLRVDYVDLYQCHRYDDATPLEETMQALSEVVRAGKARAIGFSEWPADKIGAATQMPGVERFVSSQPQYSLLVPRAEASIFPLCRGSGISQIVFSPLAQGVLSGKYVAHEPPPPGTRAADPNMNASVLNQDLLSPARVAAVAELAPLAREAGLTLAQFSLAWVLRRNEVASAIIGASRPEQIDDNVAASGAVVDPALFVEAERRLATVCLR